MLSFTLALVSAATTATPPAIPLLTADPYLSSWSEHGRLTDDWPRHWSGAITGMCGMVRIDGTPYRFCGPLPGTVAAAHEVARTVRPLSSSFVFLEAGVEFTVEFASLAGLASSMEESSFTLGCVRMSARSIDRAPHTVVFYLDVTGEWCTNSDGTEVSWSRHRIGAIEALGMGSTSQEHRLQACDRCRIDWGRIIVAPAVRSARSTQLVACAHDAARAEFAKTGSLPADDLRMPRAVNDEWPVLAMASTVTAADDGSPATCDYIVLLDEHYCAEYFMRPLESAWVAAARARGEAHDASAALVWASNKLADPTAMTRDRDAEDRLIREATAVGGARYAELVSLAFRQVMAGHSFAADFDGTPLIFSKENTSNGCIGTVDVIYPACPFFLYHNPAMLRAQLKPVLDYAASGRWRFPFAPHDLGTHPRANGQVYGGGERTDENQMPVEESANMLIMLAALAKVEGTAEFSTGRFDLLERWAQYLKEYGRDPVHQLCTDDFAGHLARNVNLSAKSIIALGAYAQLLGSAGRTDDAARWRSEAERQVAWWVEHARGSHATRLVFGDGPAPEGAWSQKYNLVWDLALGLDLFPREVFAQEIALYRTKIGRYGLPLDSRASYTKLDWSSWTACLTRSRTDFDAIMNPSYAWASCDPPPSRVPLSDWYETTDGKTRGMYARTVVGGVWMPLLMSKLGVQLDSAGREP